jgi:tungstate transport system substrate-binding protein
MGASLRLADERRDYVLCDRATFIAYRNKVRLEILYSGGADLYNPYSVLIVSPRAKQAPHLREARAFAGFLTGPAGQQLIGRFGVDRYGEALFRTAHGSP